MKERANAVRMKGNPLTLLGDPPVHNELAPSFVAIDSGLHEVSLEEYMGKIRVIVSVPSLDTPVCDLETHRFEKEAAALREDTQILVLSMDLPFAQKRWCGAHGVERVLVLSDHRDAAFGVAYGVLIKELRLLTRAVFVLDREGVLRYSQWVPELTEEPDYEDVLRAVAALL